MIRPAIMFCTTVLAFSQTVAAEELITRGPTEVVDVMDLPSRDLTLTPVVEGLDAPWAFAWLPGGDILVTEQFGTLRLVQDRALHPEPIAGLPEVFGSGQGGLLDVSPHPDFEGNRYVYLSYAHGTEEGNRLRVARGQLNDHRLDDVEVIFEVSQTKDGSQHFGSRFLWLPDGTLLVSVGDGGNPPRAYGGNFIREQAQNLDSHLGKVVRINADGSVPSDNPFADRPDVRPEVWSYGHRNIQGLALDPVSGRVFASEHGSQGGDELNRVEPGENYGWPLATYSVEYGPERRLITPHQALPGMQDPIAVWSPRIAPSDQVIYTGEVYPDWTGNLFLTGMVVGQRPNPDAPRNPGALLRVELDDSGAVVLQERLSIGDLRVRGVEQGPDGYLYILTTDPEAFRSPGGFNGALWRIEPFAE